MYYSLNVPVAASSIVVVAAPFAVIPIPGFPYGTCSGYAFCMPGKEKQLEHTTSFFIKVGGCTRASNLSRQAFEFYTQHIGVSYPFRSYKHIFLDEVYQPAFTGCTVSIFRYEAETLEVVTHIVAQTYCWPKISLTRHSKAVVFWDALSPLNGLANTSFQRHGMQETFIAWPLISLGLIHGLSLVSPTIWPGSLYGRCLEITNIVFA